MKLMYNIILQTTIHVTTRPEGFLSLDKILLRKDLVRKEQSKVISMLVAMETEDGLRRGAIMVVTKK